MEVQQMTEKKSGVEIGEYNGHPVLQIWSDLEALSDARKAGKANYWKPAVSFGLGKAKLIVACMPQIVAFVEQFDKPEAAAQSNAAPATAVANADATEKAKNPFSGL